MYRLRLRLLYMPGEAELSVRPRMARDAVKQRMRERAVKKA